jgi:quaternary ammonium compound-resistance protein SugE
MSWWLLVAAGLLEVAWVTGMKMSQGFTRLVPSVLTVVGLTASMWLLGLAAKELPIGTAYGVWVGIGAVGALIVGVTVFDEPLTPGRTIFAVMLVVAIVGLKLTARA